MYVTGNSVNELYTIDLTFHFFFQKSNLKIKKSKEFDEPLIIAALFFVVLISIMNMRVSDFLLLPTALNNT